MSASPGAPPPDAPSPDGAAAAPADAATAVSVPAPAKSRAGRNLPAAIAVGLLMGGIALASLYFWTPLFLVVILAAIIIGANELSEALAGRGITLAKMPLLLAAGLLPIVAFVFGPRNGPIALVVAFGLMFLFTLFWRLLRYGVAHFVRDATASAFVLGYAPLMGGFAALIATSPDGADRVVVFVVLSVASDIGGYATGVLWGKHPMAPHISPKKSWEGFAGSLTLQVVLGAALFVWLLEAPWWMGAIVGAIMTVTATLGDFVESAIKRDLGIKDMSNLLPGHGGLMDRLDSIIPNTVVAYALFAVTLGLW
ncbi:MAG TPA: phosphatidate cytidylyltransferase [Candidatus Nanopelagicales bacterium]